MLRDHTLHILVIAFLLIYPGLSSIIQSGETTGIFKLIFPKESAMLEILILGLFAISFDYISGYTGYLSFGHSLFFGIGAFMVLGSRTNAFRQRFLPEVPGISAIHDFSVVPFLDYFGPSTPLLQVMIGAILLSIIIALAVGLVSFQLTGVYFAMITLGVAEVARFLVEGYISETGINAPGVVNADYVLGLPGLGGVNLAESGGSTIVLNDVPLMEPLIALLNNMPIVGSYVPRLMRLSSLTSTYLIVGLVAVLCYFMMQRIVHSPFGKVMIAIRENEERASAIGYNTYWYKNATYAISGAFGTVAGVLFGPLHTATNATNTFGVLEVAGPALIGTIIGGIGTLAGPLYGIMFDENVREIFDEELVPFLNDTFGQGALQGVAAAGTNLQEVIAIWLQGHAELYTGLIFVVFVLFVPGGLLGTLRLGVGGKLGSTFGSFLGRLSSPTEYRSERLRNAVQAVPIPKLQFRGRLGVLVGGAAFALSYVVAYVLKAGSVGNAIDGVTSAAPDVLSEQLADPTVLEAVGWVVFQAHLVPIRFTLQKRPNVSTKEEGQVTTTSGPIADLPGSLSDALEPGILLMAVPVVLLVVAGFVLAMRLDVSDPRKGATVGSSLVVGYLLIGVVGSYLAAYGTTAQKLTEGTFENKLAIFGVSISPSLLHVIVIVGLIYPLLFGGIGGAIAGFVNSD